LKFFLIIFCFAIPFLPALGQMVAFPEVVIKGIETEFTVTGELQNTQRIAINGHLVELRHIGEQTYTGKTLLKSNSIELSNGFEHNHPKVIPGWLSLLPPLIAIILALLFKEVISSLFIGIFIGAATIGLYTGGIGGVFGAFLTVLDHYILAALTDPDHISVILFSVIIGSIVAVISKNGGMQGVVNRLIRFATNRKSGMLTTYFLGLAIFFDDYANTLVVGNTMRSVTDKLRISREKLAYIVDSTAAPIAAVAFITTWIGAELTYISDGVSKIEAQGGVINESAYSIFVSSLAYSFYPIFTLFFMFFLLYKGRDFGPMLQKEREAIKNGVEPSAERLHEMEEFEPFNKHITRSFNAIIPIAIVIIGTFTGLVYTGLESISAAVEAMGHPLHGSTWASIDLLEGKETSFFRKLGIVIGEADSYKSLLWSSIVGLTMAIFLSVSQGIMKLGQTMETVVFGIKTMIPAVVILVLAWSLAGVTEDLNTALYLKSFFGEEFKYVWVVPALTFVLSAFIAFSTGSSWSTMALMYPLVIPLSYSLIANGEFTDLSLMYNTIASVLAGAVLGDHCSPISDTTILSSLATSCNHISHVKTQMPYALTVGAVALFLGVIPAAMGISSFILVPIGILVLYLIVHYFGKQTES
jgi:Na+/H+ antiporter NhaC